MLASCYSARSAGKLLLGTLPSSIRSRPDVLAFVPVAEMRLDGGLLLGCQDEFHSDS